MLSLNLYSYGKMNGRNDDYNQQHDDNRKLINVIFKVAEQHNNFPVDKLIKLAEEEEIVYKYFFNENTNVTDDKKAQDMICTILPSYDEDEVDMILAELDC